MSGCDYGDDGGDDDDDDDDDEDLGVRHRKCCIFVLLACFSATIATVPADETVEPKDLVLLLPLLVTSIKSSERKENRD